MYIKAAGHSNFINNPFTRKEDVLVFSLVMLTFFRIINQALCAVLQITVVHVMLFDRIDLD